MRAAELVFLLAEAAEVVWAGELASASAEM